LEQLRLALLRPLLQLRRALLEPLRLGLQILLLRRLRGGRQGDRLLIECLNGGVELALHLSDLVAESLHFAVERRLRRLVPWSLLQDLTRVDVADLEALRGPRYNA